MVTENERAWPNRRSCISTPKEVPNSFSTRVLQSSVAIACCIPPNERLCYPVMSDVTRTLSAIEQGDPHAAGQLLPLVYEELRRLAAHRLARPRPFARVGHPHQKPSFLHFFGTRKFTAEPVFK